MCVCACVRACVCVCARAGVCVCVCFDSLYRKLFTANCSLFDDDEDDDDNNNNHKYT